MELYEQIAERIIESQEAIIGPVALEQAEHVPNMRIDRKTRKVTISGDGAPVINALVEKYKVLFGQISVEVSREAAFTLLDKLTPEQQPKVLK